MIVVDSVREIVINGEPFHEDAEVEGTGVHPLEQKEHYFYIVVKSGTTSRSYEVKVVRLNGNARLKNLAISIGKLVPEFHEDTLNYAIVVPGHVTSIGIRPDPSNPLATVTGGGIIPIGSRDTIISIIVTSEDKVTTLVYNILVTRNSDMTDARLEAIVLSGGVLEPEFSPDVFAYSLVLPCGESRNVDIKGTPANGCTLQYFADKDSVSEYPKGDSVSLSLFTIRSTAIDGKYLDYKIAIAQPLDSTLIVPYWNDVLAVNLNTSTNGGYIFSSFQWTKDGNPIEGATGSYIQFSNPSPGSYGVILVGNGKKTFVCPVYTTGTRSMRGLTAYPNPVSDNLTIESPRGTTDKIELYDLNGQRLRTYPSTGDKTIINISEYSPGIYILRQGANSVNIIKQ